MVLQTIYRLRYRVYSLCGLRRAATVSRSRAACQLKKEARGGRLGSWRRGLERHGQRSARAGSLRGSVGCRLVLDVRGLRAQQAVDVLAATAAASVMHVSGNPGARASHALIGVGQELWRLRGVQPDGSVSARREGDSSSSCWTGSRVTCQTGLTCAQATYKEALPASRKNGAKGQGRAHFRIRGRRSTTYMADPIHFTSIYDFTSRYTRLLQCRWTKV